MSKKYGPRPDLEGALERGKQLAAEVKAYMAKPPQDKNEKMQDQTPTLLKRYLLETAALVDKLEAERDRLREALEWYADSKNWQDGIERWGFGQGESRPILSAIKSDHGERARKVLELK